MTSHGALLKQLDSEQAADRQVMDTEQQELAVGQSRRPFLILYALCALLLQASILSFQWHYETTDIEDLHRGIYDFSYILAILTLGLEVGIFALACRSALSKPQWSTFDDTRLTHSLVGTLVGTLIGYMLFVLAVSGWSFLGAVLLGVFVLGVVAWRIGREIKSRRSVNAEDSSAV